MRAIVLALATLALVYRAWSRKSLTPVGIFTATITAVVHAIHPWNVCFVLLAAFFLAGNFVTKVKHAQKSTLTTSSTGGSIASVPSARTAIQVLCNSLPASLLILAHAYYLRVYPFTGSTSHTTNPPTASLCLANPASTTTNLYSSRLVNALPYGIIASYASAAADTFSSELGILSAAPPFLITDVLGILTLSPRRVPKGTNGGVTLAGLVAGLLGAAVMGLAAITSTPSCAEWKLKEKGVIVACVAAVGLAGSVLDSVLGAVLQASVVDARTGKVVEGEGGVKVLYNSRDGGTGEKANGSDGKGRKVVSGMDILDNNGVNLLMLSIMAFGTVAAVASIQWTIS